MNIYVLDADVNNYRGIYYTDEDDIVDFNLRFNGVSLKEHWTDQDRFRFVPRNLPKGDSPGLSTHIPVFGTRTVKALADMLQGNGELLPISCGGEEYYLFNVTRIVDALDEENCDLERFDDGRILDIDDYSFFQEKLIGMYIFKIPQLVLSDVFVTDPFVERVSEAKLKGFEFRLVWSSD